MKTSANISANPHLTTHHPVRNCQCSSDLPVRVMVVYAIRRTVRQSTFGDGGFFDIVCPPGGRLKMSIGCSASPPSLKPSPLFQFKVFQG